MTVTDYERNPPTHRAKTDYDKNPPTREQRQRSAKDEQELFQKWLDRKNEAEEDRKQYLTQIKVNRKFAVGKQHMNVNVKDGRVLDVRERNGVKMVTSDILGRFLQAAVGRMASTDYRSNFIAAQENTISEDITKQLNLAFGWGWEHEWVGDKKVLQLLRLLVVDGTAAIRVRFDKRFGEVVGEFYFKQNEDGYEEPILPAEDGSRDDEIKFVAEEHAEGRYHEKRTLREGKVVWEMLTAENILPPPGFDDPSDFPHEIICRPVLVSDLKERYPKATALEEEEIESSGTLTAGLGFADEQDAKLKGRMMVYTGYERPCAKYPNGMTVVFTNRELLDSRDHLPYDYPPKGPSTGVHYFRWQVVPGRFMGRAFIEGGIGPQQIRNKRLTQVDTQIDRGLTKVFIEEQSLSRPKSGEPMEIIEVRPGSPLPKVEQGVPIGGWMFQDIKLQEENVQAALGITSVSLGQAPPGVTAYSALALLNENNAMQLDPIAQELRLEMVELSWDTMEAMRNWPIDKQMLIAGPEGDLQVFLFNSNQIPNRYVVRPPRGGALPRSQAAELQKINDIWQASGGRLPLQWYVDSLDAGSPQDIPPSPGDEQLHKAELENIAMATSLAPAPVSEADDDAKHAESHRAFQTKIRILADLGDAKAMAQVEVFETHLKEHEMSAANKASNVSAPPDMGMPPGMGTRLPPQNLPQGGQTAVPSVQSPQVPQGG